MVGSPAPALDRQREPRRSVLIRARVTSGAAGCSQEMRVRNLSDHGACLDHRGELATGDRLVIDIGLVEGLTATVRWATALLAGVAFDAPVDLSLARQSRAATLPPRTGWLADLRSPY